jgi:porphobilinogen synthase
MTDVALDPYTSHGQDGLPDDNGYIVNEKTIAMLIRQALVQAEAGVDIVAPSDMMDGRIGAIRNGAGRKWLDPHPHHGLLGQVRLRLLRPIPRRGRFRGQPGQGRQEATYQMDPANSDEALREVAPTSPKAPTW